MFNSKKKSFANFEQDPTKGNKSSRNLYWEKLPFLRSFTDQKKNYLESSFLRSCTDQSELNSTKIELDRIKKAVVEQLC